MIYIPVIALLSQQKINQGDLHFLLSMKRLRQGFYHTGMEIMVWKDFRPRLKTLPIFSHFGTKYFTSHSFEGAEGLLMLTVVPSTRRNAFSISAAEFTIFFSPQISTNTILQRGKKHFDLFWIKKWSHLNMTSMWIFCSVISFQNCRLNFP